MSVDKIAKELTNIIKNSDENKTSPYDTAAEVLRVEGDTAWVHIPGGVDETPVKLTINASQGDTVQVRVAGGKAWITGNISAPPTDDSKANVAINTAEDASKKASRAVKLAEEVTKIAGNENQYYWHTQEGTDTGSHITQIPREDFLANPQNGGWNLLARSNGIALRDGLNETAIFGRSTILGESGSSQITLSPTGMVSTYEDGTEALRMSTDSSFANYYSTGLSGYEQIEISELEPYKVIYEFPYTPITGSVINVAVEVYYYVMGIGGSVTKREVVEMSFAENSQGEVTSINADGTLIEIASFIDTRVVSEDKPLVIQLSSDTGSTKYPLTIRWMASMQYADNSSYTRISGKPSQLLLRNSRSNATSSIRAWYGGQYGNNLVINSGGNFFAGGGEYAHNRYAYDLGESTGEDTYIGADGTLYLESNANTITNRKTWRLATSGHLVAGKNSQGVYGVDRDGNEYPYVRDNGTNLWIGATAVASRHHIGGTIISAGYDPGDNQGYGTIYIAVPNEDNNNATTYGVYHRGNLTNATTSSAGLMSSADKTKLDNLNYQAGETVTLSNVSAVGYATTTLGEYYFFLDTPKQTPSGKSLTISSIVGTIRGVGGLVCSGANLEWNFVDMARGTSGKPRIRLRDMQTKFTASTPAHALFNITFTIAS